MEFHAVAGEETLGRHVDGLPSLGFESTVVSLLDLEGVVPCAALHSLGRSEEEGKKVVGVGYCMANDQANAIDASSTRWRFRLKSKSRTTRLEIANGRCEFTEAPERQEGAASCRDVNLGRLGGEELWWGGARLQTVWCHLVRHPCPSIPTMLELPARDSAASSSTQNQISVVPKLRLSMTRAAHSNGGC